MAYDFTIDYKGYYENTGDGPFPAYDPLTLPTAFVKFIFQTPTSPYYNGQRSDTVCGYVSSAWRISSASYQYYTLTTQYVRYKAPSEIRVDFEYHNTGNPHLLVRNPDNSKWFKITPEYGAAITPEYRVRSYNQDDVIIGPYTTDFSGFAIEITLSVATTGRVNVEVVKRNADTSGCSIATDNLYNAEPLANPIFATDEELIFEWYNGTDHYPNSYINTLRLDLTYLYVGECLAIFHPSLDALTCEISATNTPNADVGIDRALAGNFQGSPSPTEAAFLALMEVNSNGTNYYWGAGYVQLNLPAGNVWAFKSKHKIRSPYRNIHLWDKLCSVVILSEDESKWIKFGLYWDRYMFIETSTSPGTLYWKGTTQYSALSYNDYHHMFNFKVTEDNTVYLRGHVFGFEPVILGPFTDFFDKDEALYVGIGSERLTNTGDYIYFRQHLDITSLDLLPSGVQARLLAFDFNLDVNLALPPPEVVMCYIKQCIRNSQDYSDVNSLYGMNPSQPSDEGIPLKENDICIVIEKHNRIYYYILKTGYHITELPYYIRMTDSLYWELLEVNLGEPKLIVEQYDIQGLVNTNEVIVTHAAHNRSKSYAPVVQLLHYNRVRTNGITVAVKSNTELRLSTVETSVIENLKINVFVTP